MQLQPRPGIIRPRWILANFHGSYLGSSVNAGPKIHVHDLRDEENPLSLLDWSWRRVFETDRTAPIALAPEQVHFENGRISRTDSREAWIVKATQGLAATSLAVLLPHRLTIRKLAEWGPHWTMRGYRLAGNHILCRTGDGVLQALLNSLGENLVKRGADFLLAENVEDNSPLWSQLMGLRELGFDAVLPKGVQRAHQIRLPETPGEYWSKFSGTSRKSFRRLLRRWEGSRLLRVTEPDQVDSFLRDAARVSENSWQRRSLGRRVHEDAPARRMYLALAERGALRSYLLYDGEMPVAFEIGTQFNGVFAAEETGYDLTYAKSSPGQALQLLELEDLLTHDRPDWYDYGLGDGDYKQHFGNHVTRRGNLLLLAPGKRQRWLGLCLRGFLLGGAMAKQAARLVGLQAWLRKQRRQSDPCEQPTTTGDLLPLQAQAGNTSNGESTETET